MTKIINETELEVEVLNLLQEQRYEVLFGPDISPDGNFPERNSYSDVILINRLQSAISRINPTTPPEAQEEAIKKILRTDAPSLLANNRLFHRMITDGVDVEYRKDGRITGDKVWLFDFSNPENNEFLAVNQFTIIEDNNNRRPDIIIFINGLPLIVI